MTTTILLALLSLSAADALCGGGGAMSGSLLKPVTPRSVVVLRGGGAIATQWGRYLQALEEKPMVTKMTTAAVLAGTGDVIAQRIEASGTFAVRRLLTLVAVNVLCATMQSQTLSLLAPLRRARLRSARLPVADIVPILTVFYAANEWLAAQLKLEV